MHYLSFIPQAVTMVSFSTRLTNMQHGNRGCIRQTMPSVGHELHCTMHLVCRKSAYPHNPELLPHFISICILLGRLSSAAWDFAGLVFSLQLSQYLMSRIQQLLRQTQQTVSVLQVES